MPASREPFASDGWRFKFPNLADFNFNYYKLMRDDGDSPIATAPRDTAWRLAIIGAGVAGLTAARELFRSGYTNIDIYEATDRIVGARIQNIRPSPMASPLSSVPCVCRFSGPMIMSR
jgi:tryptophan 2-monooxygenase